MIVSDDHMWWSAVMIVSDDCKWCLYHKCVLPLALALARVINYAPKVTLSFVAALTDEFRGIIYEGIMFMALAAGQCFLKKKFYNFWTESNGIVKINWEKKTTYCWCHHLQSMITWLDKKERHDIQHNDTHLNDDLHLLMLSVFGPCGIIMSFVRLSYVILNVVSLESLFTHCCYTKCVCTEYCYTGCRYAEYSYSVFILSSFWV